MKDSKITYLSYPCCSVWLAGNKPVPCGDRMSEIWAADMLTPTRCTLHVPGRLSSLKVASSDLFNRPFLKVLIISCQRFVFRRESLTK
jgi:hypothetical protein